MATRFGNTGASSLLRTATSINNKQQAYDDAIQAYIYDLSPKSEDDYARYESYLKGAQAKTTDPSKSLSYDRTITSASRSFNSSDIARQSLEVNYGDISNTDKYNHMFGLYQRALGNGDYSLAQSIEGQMASLSKTIQSEAEAAANAKGSAGRKAAADGIASYKTQLNDFENKVDRAYQTGQPLKVDGKDLQMDAPAYAINRAQILQSRHQLLSQQAQDDPKYADDLSQLEKSSEYRNLINSGLVQFDESGKPIASEQLKNLAVTFKKDPHTGVISRDYTSPDMLNGKAQYGLAKADDEFGGKKQLFVADRQLASDTTDPGLKSRVAYGVDAFNQNDKAVKGVGSYNDRISGNQVLVQTAGDNRGLRATAYNGKKEQRTPDQALDDLQSLVSSQSQPGGNAKPTAGGLFDLGNAKDFYSGVKLPNVAKGAAHFVNDAANVVDELGNPIGEGIKALGKGLGVKSSRLGSNNPLNYIGKIADFGTHLFNVRAAQAAAKAAADKAAADQAASLRAAWARQQSIATTAAARAATPAGAPRVFTPAAASLGVGPVAQGISRAAPQAVRNINAATGFGKSLPF